MDVDDDIGFKVIKNTLNVKVLLAEVTGRSNLLYMVEK
jgi:hypothetical protein